MRIYIMTDMEGCAGILNHDDWVIPSGRYFEKGVSILTNEVNAAIEGFIAGGAKEFLVVDGHGAGGIDPLRLHPAAELSRGAPNPVYPWLLDKDFDGAAWIGHHAKSGTPFSHITHTQWFNWLDLSINGISIGEYGETALCAMELGVPSFFASGEQALCEEARALTPGVVTVSVKRGILPDGLDQLSEDEYRKAKLSAIHLSPAEACRRIKVGAEKAVAKLRKSPGAFRYPKIRKPYRLVRKMRSGAGKPPLVQEACHPTSIIAALNTPWKDAAE